MGRNFMTMLRAQWAKGNFVCVGLDSEYAKLPECMCKVSVLNAIIMFNRAIVETTKDLVCAYKPNTAFYEAYGDDGIRALWETIQCIHTVAPYVPVILDAKRADIGNTNAGYVDFAFNYLQADAITVHPYLGREAMQPFLDCKDKGIIVLCRTSNPGADEFQDLEVRKRDHLSHIHPEDNQWEPLYTNVARRVSNEWNKNGNCAIVVGATYPEELGEVRKIVGDMPILIPGVGFQQKDVPLSEQVRQVVGNGKDSRGKGMIINSSRGIIFASKGDDFAKAARRETQKLAEQIYLKLTESKIPAGQASPL